MEKDYTGIHRSHRPHCGEPSRGTGPPPLPAAATARRLGVTPQWLGRRVNAQVSPNLDDLAQISEALGVSVTELLRESA